MKSHEQKRPITAQDADGVTIEGMARGGSWGKRRVKEEDGCRAKRGEHKWAMGNHRDTGKNRNRNETIDKHEERP